MSGLVLLFHVGMPVGAKYLRVSVVCNIKRSAVVSVWYASGYLLLFIGCRGLVKELGCIVTSDIY